MAAYTLECGTCGARREVVRRMSEAAGLSEVCGCGGSMTRVYEAGRSPRVQEDSFAHPLAMDTLPPLAGDGRPHEVVSGRSEMRRVLRGLNARHGWGLVDC